MESYETVLLVKPEVYVFNLPPRSSNRGYRAADWKLDQPSWSGRMRLVVKDNKCALKLEDKASGELFAKCPIETYPSVAVEAVTDSSRYFVIKLEDDNGRTAYVGLGFGDRSDSFDLSVALSDHFKWMKKEHEMENEPSRPELDLAFKEGETIKINMKITKKDGSDVSSRTKPSKPSSVGILAPPPGPNKIAPPPGSNKTTPLSSPAHSATTPTTTGGDKSPQAASQTNWVQF